MYIRMYIYVSLICIIYMYDNFIGQDVCTCMYIIIIGICNAVTPTSSTAASSAVTSESTTIELSSGNIVTVS